MKKLFLFQLIFCLTSFSLCMYFYLEKQNQLTFLRMTIPQISQQIRLLKEDIAKCEYEIDQFESPSRLMELANLPEFSHLKHPYAESILTVAEGKPWPDETIVASEKMRSLPIAIGAGR